MTARKMYFPFDASRDGIDISYTRASGLVTVGGWYDHCVGITSSVLPLGDLLRGLGITLKDCERALKGGGK